MTIEYRLRRVERFFVTRHEETELTGSTKQIGSEYPGFETAYEVASALARQEQERLGLPSGDMGVIFPSPSLEDARDNGPLLTSGAINLALPPVRGGEPIGSGGLANGSFAA